MKEGTLFAEMTLDGRPLGECEMVLQTGGTQYRLYVVKEPDQNAFRAMAVQFISCESGDDVWQCPALTVEQVFHVVAYFDGVRHLEFNRESVDSAGYLYYPNMQGVINLLQKVREIELEICRDCDKD